MAVQVVPQSVALGPRCNKSLHIDADRFEQLVLALRDALGPSSGLTSDDVDVDFLSRLMEDYDCADATWSRYAFGDITRGYTRNLVDEGNGKCNLVSIHIAKASIRTSMRLTAC